jgi:ABC-type branched-subunit amino acid transport system ATPase component
MNSDGVVPIANLEPHRIVRTGLTLKRDLDEVYGCFPRLLERASRRAAH